MGFGDFISSAVGMITNAGQSLLSNAMNVSNARDAREWQGEQAGIQYERSMDAYKSRYQNTVADMRAAGLNPILAASGGFSVGNAPNVSLPSGAQAAPVYVGDISSSAKNYAEVSRMEKEKEVMTAEETRKYAEVEKIGQEIKESIQKTAKMRAETGVATAEEAVKVAEVDRIGSEISKNLFTIEKTKEEIARIRVEVPNIEQQTRLIQEQQRVARAEVAVMVQEARKLREVLVQLTKTSDAYRGDAGKWLGYLNAITGAANIGIGAVATMPLRGGKR